MCDSVRSGNAGYHRVRSTFTSCRIFSDSEFRTLLTSVGMRHVRRVFIDRRNVSARRRLNLLRDSSLGPSMSSGLYHR